MNKIIKKTLSDVGDLAVSIFPELTMLLNPQIADNPEAVLLGVGSAILKNKAQKFYSEFKDRQSKKLIKEDKESIKDSFYDMLKFINENPTDDKLEAVKKIFFKSIKPDASEIEQQLGFELMQICKKLDTNDLQVLSAAYRFVSDTNKKSSFNGVDLSNRFRNSWFQLISNEIGHSISSLVAMSENKLVELKLITPSEIRSENQYFPEGRFRLTDLGIRLCSYLSTETLN